MKKYIIFLVMLISGMLCACGNKAESDTIESEIVKEESNVDEINRTIIAEALGIEENSRNIRFILAHLQTIGAGQIQDAKYSELDGEKIVTIVAQDNTNYRIYLKSSGSVAAIENVDTGEWPVRSMQ